MSQDKPCIIPVARDSALAWLAGNLTDNDLLLHAPLTPEALFFFHLPSRIAWRAGCHQMLHWWRQGALFAVWRTQSGQIERHLAKLGAVAVLKETAGHATAFRYILQPDPFHAFMQSLDPNQRKRRQSAPVPALTPVDRPPCEASIKTGLTCCKGNCDHYWTNLRASKRDAPGCDQPARSHSGRDTATVTTPGPVTPAESQINRSRISQAARSRPHPLC